MHQRFLSAARGVSFAVAAAALAVSVAAPARADLLTYNVNLTFDPNSTPTASLGPAGPGTITGMFTIDTSIPVNSPTSSSGNQVTNLVSADLIEASNNGTLLSGFSNSAVQEFDAVTPFDIIFFGSPVTIFPNQARLVNNSLGELYELVSFISPPIIDSIPEGPSFQFDFPYPGGGSVLPGNFDSIASTGFDSFLFGTVTAVPEPTALGLIAIGSVCVAQRRRRRIA